MDDLISILCTLKVHSGSEIAFALLLSIPHSSDQDADPLESDPVSTTSREENSEETSTSSNPPGNDHNPYQRDHHAAPTTEGISDGPREEITPHLEASFSPAVYNSLFTIHYTLYTILTLTSNQDMAHDKTFIPSRCSISSWTY